MLLVSISGNRAMSSELCVNIYAGLGNRMRVLDSAISLSRKNGSTLNVIWNSEKKFNCRFEELFLLPEIVNSIEYRKLQTIPGKLHRAMAWLDGRRFDLRLSHKDIRRLRYQNTEIEALTRNRKVYISTDSDFMQRSPKFRDFSVVEPLAEIIRGYTDRFERTIGVHIRRTDNKKAKKHSPTSLFIANMEQEIAASDDTTFFLATDSPEVEDELRGIFGERIITHNKRSRDRNDPDAIKDALVDLYCLAGCRRIYGSFWSSFTETAAAINDVELNIVKAAQ